MKGIKKIIKQILDSPHIPLELTFRIYDYEYIYMSLRDYNAILIRDEKEEGKWIYKSYKDVYKFEMIDNLEKINKEVGRIFYIDLMRENKLKQLGI